MARIQRKIYIALLGIGLAALTGCASQPAPKSAMTQARQMLAAARAVQATVFAPLELGEAQAKFNFAQQALAKQAYEQARTLANEAEATAELARTRSLLKDVQHKIQMQHKENARLRRELLGKDSPPPSSHTGQGGEA